MFDRLRVIAVLAVCATVVSVGASAAASDLDQQVISSGCGQPVYGTWAQTFTAGKTGTLTSVVLQATGVAGPFDPGDASASLQVWIENAASRTVHVSNGYNWNQFGSRTAPSGNPLSSTTAVNLPIQNSYASIPVVFTSPASIVAGNEYAIVFTSTSSLGVQVRLAAACGTTDSYPAGSLFFGNTADLTYWYDYGTQLTQAFGNFYADAAFSTYVQLDAAGQLAALLEQVEGAGPGNSLTAKVTRIQAAVANNNTSAACSLLKAFVNEVQAQTGKSIMAAQGAVFTGLANTIMATLGCR